jgi:hypothetical protein
MIRSRRATGIGVHADPLRENRPLREPQYEDCEERRAATGFQELDRQTGQEAGGFSTTTP